MAYIFYILVGLNLVIVNTFHLKPPKQNPINNIIGAIIFTIGVIGWVISLFTKTIGSFPIEDILGICGPFIFALILVMLFKRHVK